MGAAYTPETWDAWTEKMKAAHGNGNGHGPSLNVEVQRLLPTYAQAAQDDRCLPPCGAFDRPHLLDECYGMTDWGKYAAAIARQEHAFGRPAPAPTETGPKGNPRLSCRFDEWLMGLPDGWITDVPGITHNEALKAAGNGVVPQQAAAALRLMLARASEAAA